MSSLAQHTNYRNPYFNSLTNVSITEYDMKDAGFNLSKYYKLLPESDLKYLENLPKMERTIKMGMMQKKDKEFRRALMQAFRDGRELFFKANDLDDTNVLAIKKDAIFTIKLCPNNEFDNIIFAEKSKYSSYYLFDRYEYYYFTEGIDVKGISDEKVLQHAEFMITALHEFMYLMENSSRVKSIRYLKEFIDHYKNMELPIGFYRELNRDSLFRLKKEFSETSMGIEYINDKSLVDIHYNFNNYLTKLIEFLI